MLKWMVRAVLLMSIPVAAQVQGALLVVTKQSHALAIVDGSDASGSLSHPDR